MVVRETGTEVEGVGVEEVGKIVFAARDALCFVFFGEKRGKGFSSGWEHRRGVRATGDGDDECD